MPSHPAPNMRVKAMPENTSILKQIVTELQNLNRQVATVIQKLEAVEKDVPVLTATIADLVESEIQPAAR
jgi:hypothetical protein